MLSNKIHKAKGLLISNSYLALYGKANHYRNNISPSKTILLFSNPRGGSTWLAEIMAELPRTTTITEPLMVRKVRDFEKLNFYWNQPIPENAEWPEAEETFRKLFNIEILPYSIYRGNNLLSIPFSDTFIFKFCFGNLLLPWIVKKFDVKPVLLVRHPCAVISSQMKHGSWSKIEKAGFKYDIPDFKFNDFYLQYLDILGTIKTFEEHLAASWAFTMINSVMHPENDKSWITIAYENLYNNFEYEIHRVFDRLNLPIPETVWERQIIPSSTTKKGSVDTILHGSQMESWKKNLSKKQIDNIFGILHEFGLDFYDHSPEPDLKKIYINFGD